MTTLVAGGAASGKSEYAEGLVRSAVSSGDGLRLFYAATMTATDDESLERIRKHRARREGQGYETVECPDAEALLTFVNTLSEETGPVVLLDDLGNYVANELFADAPGPVTDRRLTEEEREAFVSRLLQPLARLCETAGTFLAVSNLVFADAYPPAGTDPGTDNYLQVLGGLNRAFAALADEVCEVTAGLPQYYKGGPQT